MHVFVTTISPLLYQMFYFAPAGESAAARAGRDGAAPGLRGVNDDCNPFLDVRPRIPRHEGRYPVRGGAWPAGLLFACSSQAESEGETASRSLPAVRPSQAAELEAEAASMSSRCALKRFEPREKRVAAEKDAVWKKLKKLRG